MGPTPMLPRGGPRSATPVGDTTKHRALRQAESTQARATYGMTSSRHQTIPVHLAAMTKRMIVEKREMWKAILCLCRAWPCITNDLQHQQRFKFSPKGCLRRQRVERVLCRSDKATFPVTTTRNVYGDTVETEAVDPPKGCCRSSCWLNLHGCLCSFGNCHTTNC